MQLQMNEVVVDLSCGNYNLKSLETSNELDEISMIFITTGQNFDHDFQLSLPHHRFSSEIFPR